MIKRRISLEPRRRGGYLVQQIIIIIIIIIITNSSFLLCGIHSAPWIHFLGVQ
jgi:hypothetical protein